MRVVHTIKELRQIISRRAGDIGFVPTMGALHAGHTSLMARARRECDLVVASIFVNPLQFGANEDLARYPRPFDADASKAFDSGVDVLFAPDALEMYPQPMQTSVTVGAMGTILEGASRPGHFDGMATVVAKLLSIVGPCRAYFGEKDFQQLALINRLVDDLDMPVDVVGCAVVRDADGLALSSRNVFLSARERAAALCLSRALAAGSRASNAVGSGPSRVEEAMAAVLAAEPLVRVDYAVVVDALTLARASGDVWPSSARALIAAQIGTVRLIDNAAVG